MSLRPYSFLLPAAVLLMLNACSTTSPIPPTAPVGEMQAPEPTESVADDRTDRIRLDPSMRSLAETIELSKSMEHYQAEVSLEILRSLESISSGELRTMIDGQQYDPEFTEWLELALQVRPVMIDDSSIELAARQWADFHYGHAVTRENFSELVRLYQSQYPAPLQVAILLPTQGGLAAAARAIRDGVMSAYFENPGNSIIRFYSSGENSESAVKAYLQARLEGATQVVGPLRIESTRAIANLAELSVPVLLLNEALEDDTQAPVHTNMVNSLSLSQSEEAIAIANKALSQALNRAIVLVPDSTWGKRIESAFSTAFENAGGFISATARFDSTTSDHSDVLTKLLNIDESRQRKADLQSRIGVPLKFEPTRRDDFDFIFMAASPSEGRELKPLLRFHDTGDVPVYAMGRIYGGKVEYALDQDLNGVIFQTTPWQLNPSVEAALTLDSIRDGAFAHLFALGQDAWQILPWLPLLRKDPDLWFPGSIGALRIQDSGRLHRQPAWAEFSAGRPVSHQWPDS